jgi:hypothetical protein
MHCGEGGNIDALFVLLCVCGRGETRARKARSVCMLW